MHFAVEKTSELTKVVLDEGLNAAANPIMQPPKCYCPTMHVMLDRLHVLIPHHILLRLS